MVFAKLIYRLYRFTQQIPMSISTNMPVRRILYYCLFLMAFMMLILTGCNKKTGTITEIEPDPDPTPIPGVPVCPNAPSYGDSILAGEFKKNKPLIKKVVNDPGAGIYFAKPTGLDIDRNTGAINVGNSEAGVKYKIGFVSAKTNDTCFTNVIISGISYVDSIYVLSKNDTLAKPYYNARPQINAPCDLSDDTDYPRSGGGKGKGNDKCEYDDDEDKDSKKNDDDDDDDDDDDNNDDEPPPGQTANEQKVRVRTISGIINLKKTLADGAFGKNPKNGTSKEVIIYYRLNDASKKSLKKVKVKLLYYDKRSDVPDYVVKEVRQKRKEFLLETPLMTYVKPRPPLIVITRELQ